MMNKILESGDLQGFMGHHELRIDITVGGSFVHFMPFNMLSGLAWEILTRHYMLANTSANQQDRSGRCEPSGK